MTKLKFGPLPDGKPVKLTVELPAQVQLMRKSWRQKVARRSIRQS